MNKTMACILAGAAMGLVQVQAEIIAHYGFDSTAVSSDTQANTSAGDFAPGPGAGAFGYSALKVAGTKSAYFNNDPFYSNTEASAVTVNDYLTFSVTNGAGYAVDYNTLSFYIMRNGSGGGAGAPDHYSIYSSRDGFTTSVGGGVISGANAFVQYTVDLSGVTNLQTVTGITEFRIVMWASSGLATPTERVFRLDELKLDGSMKEVMPVSTEIYSVTPGGNTIENALNWIYSYSGAMTNDMIVEIAAGTYYLTHTLKIGPEHSGQNGHKVIFRSTDGVGSAEFVGGDLLDTGWIYTGSNDIWKIDIGTANPVGTLYENGVRARTARYPDFVLDPVYPTVPGPYIVAAMPFGNPQGPGLFSWVFFDPGSIPAGLELAQLKINLFSYGRVGGPSPRVINWSRKNFAVTSIDEVSHQITWLNNGDGMKNQGHNRFFLEDAYSFLTAPGEFFHNLTDGYLYYKAYAGGNPGSQNVIRPTMLRMFDLAGTSGSPVHDITVEGITFQDTNFTSPIGGVYDWYETEGMLTMNYTEDIEVLNCHFKNAGLSAITMHNSMRNKVWGCWIEQMGLSGIVLTHTDYCLLSNNKIHDVAYLALYAEAIGMFFSQYNEVSYSDIYNSARYATTLRGNVNTGDGELANYSYNGNSFSIGNVFKYLDIWKCGQDSGDCGAMHSAKVNLQNDVNVNYYDQILIDETRAVAGMNDTAPDGIFLDHSDTTCNQFFRDMDITNGQNAEFRSNGITNEISATMINVNWEAGYDASRIATAHIGLLSSFPSEYGGAGVAEADLMAHWKLDEISGTAASDQTGAFDGTLVNMDGGTDWVPGIKANGLDFDGVDDYIDTELSLNNYDDFTIMLWAKYQAQTTGGSIWRPLVSTGYNVDDGAVMISSKQNGVGNPDEITFQVDTNVTVNVGFSDGLWHMLTLVREGAEFRGYHGAELVATGTVDQLSIDQLVIGGSINNSTCRFKGTLDEVSVYRRALSASEISYAAYTPYYTWMANTFANPAGPDTERTADPDLDGNDNLVEYAMGGNPELADANDLQTQSPVADGGTNYFEYIYNRRLDAVARGLTYTLTTRTNLVLGAWATNTTAEVGTGAIDADFEAVTNLLPSDAIEAQFIELQIQED